jgi:hypothetical protein
VAAGGPAQMLCTAVEIAHREPVLPLRAAQPRQCDQPAQVAIAVRADRTLTTRAD